MTTSALGVQVVDETLKAITVRGLADAGVNPPPGITFGPLDRTTDGARLNWFLYRAVPNAAYRNMEPPAARTRTSRGAPPLAMELHYFLTSYPGALTDTGDQDQLAHIALASVMRSLHEHTTVGPGSPFLPQPVPRLHEPLRIVWEPLDLDTLTKVWTAASQSLRLSVGYVVSPVFIEPQVTHVVGPPVRTVGVHVLPSAGARLTDAVPPRVGGPATTTVRLSGATAATRLMLAAEPGDPAPAPSDGWPMTVVSTGPGASVLRLPRNDLMPGVRRLFAATPVDGLPPSATACTDSIALTVEPIVLSASGPVRAGASATVTTAHCDDDTLVFVDGTAVQATAVTPVSVTFPVPADRTGDRALALRSRGVTGPPTTVTVTP
ncbi:DUF4255 domain-containing protein [Yinghuangia seranimata]|uniref:DUF4255 domain-containing protein n=1 Tax=Yinghuangia seranimata TaxID=408067 RepID=UPI00248AFB94|nr:DUF4255 domain-containing protein [Yinghuangia seranimata]MDI2131693.1 DUF4255 domain-containing protein [Yinghuangia seranimata]